MAHSGDIRAKEVPSAVEAFGVGDRVQVKDLAKAFHFNGASGAVTEALPTGRLRVRLTPEDIWQGQSIDARPENLLKCQSPPRQHGAEADVFEKLIAGLRACAAASRTNHLVYGAISEFVRHEISLVNVQYHTG